MTYNLSIKQEPASPATATISTHHLSGSCCYYNNSISTNGMGSICSSTSSPQAGGYPHAAAPDFIEYKYSPDSQATTLSSKKLLKEKIERRREAEGLGDVGELFEEVKPCQLTRADMERRERRREQNRRAARKCRIKKKSQQYQVSEVSQRMQRENNQLHGEVVKLRNEVMHYKHLLEVHLKSGCCALNGYQMLQDCDSPEVHTPTPPSYQSPAVADIMADAHIPMTSDHQHHQQQDQTSQPVSQDDINLPSMGSLHGLFNLSSMDLNSINADVSTEDLNGLASELCAAQTQNFLEVHQGPNISQRTEMSLVDPNLVQNIVIVSPPPSYTQLNAGTALPSAQTFCEPPQQPSVETSAATQIGLGSSHTFLTQNYEVQYAANFNYVHPEVFGNILENQYFTNRRH